MYAGAWASELWQSVQFTALFWEWLLLTWQVVHCDDSVSIFFINRCDSSGLVMLCIGPWQVKHGTVELGVWKVELKVEPFWLE
jgi:hypothetical protein